MNKFFNELLEFEINLIGSKSIGECILFFVKADEKIVYSGLVDCYAPQIVRKELKTAGVEFLDFICWTHPHDDHTAGLADIISSLSNEKTQIWIPPVLSKETDIFSQNVRETYDELFEILKNKKENSIRAVSDVKILERFQYKSNAENLFYEFSIMSFAPDSKILLEKQISDMFNIGNLYSIGLIINIGHFYIVFAGDIENYMINSLPRMNLSSLNNGFEYLKIPHHSSKSSAGIIKRFNDMQIGAPIVAATTVYKANKLPDKEVLDMYCQWRKDINVFSTGAVSAGSHDVHPYGIVKTSIDVLEHRKCTIETRLLGNAVKVS